MKTKIFYSTKLMDDEELEAAKEYFDCREQIYECADSLIIGRYSVLPNYDYWADMATYYGGRLINSKEHHAEIASFAWYEKVKDLTPESWIESLEHCDYNGPFVVKGATNSKKWSWNTKMFAKTKMEAIKVGLELQDDTYIGDQKVVYRKYVPLKTYEIGANGLPFTNEWRFFFHHNEILSYGYYWTCASEDTIIQAARDTSLSHEKMFDTVSDTAFKLGHLPFWSADFAMTEDNEWILIEVNDGQQAGLSDINPNHLYGRLLSTIEEKHKPQDKQLTFNF